MSEAMSSLYFVIINRRQNATEEDTLKTSKSQKFPSKGSHKNSLPKEVTKIPFQRKSQKFLSKGSHKNSLPKESAAFIGLLD
jgi:hypothetical protein